MRSTSTLALLGFIISLVSAQDSTVTAVATVSAATNTAIVSVQTNTVGKS